jgi:GNAT superfamily N-acetyltransferase
VHRPYDDLAAILAAAFSPPQWSERGKAAARVGFRAVLWRAHERGIVAAIPDRAVCVLSPPRQAGPGARNPMDQLGVTCWRLSNFGAHPRGLGIGAALLAELCQLADRSGFDMCLRAGERSARLYRRAGFIDFAQTSHGTVMLRTHRATLIEAADPEIRSQIVFSGRKATAFGIPSISNPRLRTV